MVNEKGKFKCLPGVPIKMIKGQVFRGQNCSLATTSEVLNDTSSCLKNHQKICTIFIAGQ
jgi:hypothetical protein